MNFQQDKMVVMVGPTASGKSALALQLAQQYGGEIVCADSRTVYRGMDIGTAKPTARERAKVPHHLLDIVEPGETLTAAAFRALADEVISGIAKRGKVPFLVGGTGLYIDAVVFEYAFPPGVDAQKRAQLDAMNDDELRELLAAEDPEASARVDLNNRRRVIRAIETAGMGRTKRSEPREGVLMIGLPLNKEVARQQIERRIEKMLGEGLIDEVRQLAERCGWESEAMTGIGYREFRGVLEGYKTVDEAAEECVRNTLALAKEDDLVQEEPGYPLAQGTARGGRPGAGFPDRERII